jgi:hypothetical protein
MLQGNTHIPIEMSVNLRMLLAVFAHLGERLEHTLLLA